MNKKHQILKVLVGSQAHGTASEDSDVDYRGVYIEPTSQLVSMGYKYKGVSWVEGETEDQTSYELENFLNLAMQGHPNILEMFVAPIAEVNKDGKELLDLFPKIWSPEKVYKAFMNYSNNRRKHMFNTDVSEEVATKSAYCHIRVLFNLCELLETNNFLLEIQDTSIKIKLKLIKKGKWSKGEIVDLGEHLIKKAEELLLTCKQKQDEEAINQFLIDKRKKYWE